MFPRTHGMAVDHPNEKNRTFQKVIDVFDTAKYIYIASYGITTDSIGGKNKLFSELKKQSKLKPVKVITQIRNIDDDAKWKAILKEKKKEK